MGQWEVTRENMGSKLGSRLEDRSFTWVLTWYRVVKVKWYDQVQ